MADWTTKVAAVRGGIQVAAFAGTRGRRVLACCHHSCVQSLLFDGYSGRSFDRHAYVTPGVTLGKSRGPRCCTLEKAAARWKRQWISAGLEFLMDRRRVPCAGNRRVTAQRPVPNSFRSRPHRPLPTNAPSIPASVSAPIGIDGGTDLRAVFRRPLDDHADAALPDPLRDVVLRPALDAQAVATVHVHIDISHALQIGLCAVP